VPPSRGAFGVNGTAVALMRGTRPLIVSLASGHVATADAPATITQNTPAHREPMAPPSRGLGRRQPPVCVRFPHFSALFLIFDEKKHTPKKHAKNT
jgi:hypothetical protein